MLSPWLFVLFKSQEYNMGDVLPAVNQHVTKEVLLAEGLFLLLFLRHRASRMSFFAVHRNVIFAQVVHVINVWAYIF